jgi:transcriptional regulator with XRE-family HTH domain
LLRQIGQRFRAAREMNGFSQLDAAHTFGYKNSSALSKIEAGLTPVPFWLLLEASERYAVSSDYLLGLSSFPERDPRTIEQIAILRSVRGALEESTRKIAEATIIAAKDIEFGQHARLLALAAADVETSLARCHETKRFDDEVRGGARLVRAVETLTAIAQKTRKFLRRRDALCTILENAEFQENPDATSQRCA